MTTTATNSFLQPLVGAGVLREPQTSVDIGQLMRTIGLAAPPALLQVVGFIPVS